MKYRKNELDVDMIGSQEPLTIEEKKALNDYFKTKKPKKSTVNTLPEKRRIKRERTAA